MKWRIDMECRGRTTKELREAVRRGIALLDTFHSNWRRLFKLKEFNFAEPCQCVLGTIGDGDWSRGKLRLGLEAHYDHAGEGSPTYYGFDYSVGGLKREKPILQRLWVKALKGEKV